MSNKERKINKKLFTEKVKWKDKHILASRSYDNEIDSRLELAWLMLFVMSWTTIWHQRDNSALID